MICFFENPITQKIALIADLGIRGVIEKFVSFSDTEKSTDFK